MIKKILKVKIGLEETKIWYNEKFFQGKVEAVKAIISHLQRMLDTGTINETN